MMDTTGSRWNNEKQTKEERKRERNFDSNLIKRVSKININSAHQNRIKDYLFQYLCSEPSNDEQEKIKNQIKSIYHVECRVPRLNIDFALFVVIRFDFQTK